MYPASFEYLEPKTLQEAVEFLRQRGDSARILAGGQSLVPLMKLRLARPQYLIDLNRVPGLSYIREQNGWLRIGPLTRHAEIEESDLIREKAPLMQEAVRLLGDMQVRNRGTIAGAIVEADPAGDWGPVVLALNARISCVSPRGEREMDTKDFFTFAYTTAIQADEVVREISVPVPSAPSLGTYEKLELVAGDFAVASVAVQLDIDKQGVCKDIGIGVGGADEKPLKALSVEGLFRGQKISSELIETGARNLREMANPIGDLRGSPEYKKQVLAVIFRRALDRLIERSGALREKYPIV